MRMPDYNWLIAIGWSTCNSTIILSWHGTAVVTDAGLEFGSGKDLKFGFWMLLRTLAIDNFSVSVVTSLSFYRQMNRPIQKRKMRNLPSFTLTTPLSEFCLADVKEISSYTFFTHVGIFVGKLNACRAFSCTATVQTLDGLHDRFEGSTLYLQVCKPATINQKMKKTTVGVEALPFPHCLSTLAGLSTPFGQIRR